MKTKLLQNYGDSIYFAEIGGRSNVVCFKSIADYFITETWYEYWKASVEDGAKRIITVAQKRILGGIRTATYNCDSCPVMQI